MYSIMGDKILGFLPNLINMLSRNFEPNVAVDGNFVISHCEIQVLLIAEVLCQNFELICHPCMILGSVTIDPKDVEGNLA